MSYNKKNYLTRVLKAQIVVRKNQDLHKGLPLTEIYRQFIKDQFNISKSTFDKWMGIPAAKELSKIEKGKTS